MNEYKQADDFLAKHQLEFRSVLVGDDCPKYCADALAERDMDKLNTFPRRTHIHGKHYRCTISGKGRQVSFDFWNSYHDEERNYVLKHRFDPIPYALLDKHGVKEGSVITRGKPAVVTAYDVLACIEKNEVGTFDDFCSNFGYDTDSRRAEEVYHAVVKEYRKVQQFFTPEELVELQEIQ